MIRRIGCFRRHTDDFIGEIATAGFRTSARYIPVENKRHAGTPDFLIVHSETTLFSPELGLGWWRRTSEGEPYIETVIDDPTYSHHIHGVLYKGRYDGACELWNLMWSRHRNAKETAEGMQVHEELIPYIGVMRPIQKVTDYLLSIYPALAEDMGVEDGFEP